MHDCTYRQSFNTCCLAWYCPSAFVTYAWFCIISIFISFSFFISYNIVYGIFGMLRMHAWFSLVFLVIVVFSLRGYDLGYSDLSSSFLINWASNLSDYISVKYFLALSNCCVETRASYLLFGALSSDRYNCRRNVYVRLTANVKLQFSVNRKNVNLKVPINIVLIV